MTPKACALLCALLGAAIVAAWFQATPSAAAPAGGEIIPLYAVGALKPLPVPERTDAVPPTGLRVIRNVSAPTLEVFPPAPGKANGAAVIVAPGGGFMMLSYDSEGTLVAKRLAAEGVTAFVLKYRVAQTPEDPIAFLAEMRSLLTAVAAKSAAQMRIGELPRFPTEDLAVADAQQAVRLVRRRAAEWGIDPARIGLVGFSAGAITATDVAIGDQSARPDFVGIIYGAVRGPVPADAAPAFIAAAADDPLLKAAPEPLFNAWKAAGRPAELHIFERGGHGFGLTPQGSSSDHWLNEFLWWMQARGLLSAKKAP